MRHLLIPALTATAICMVSSAHAQPSFNCSAQLNPTEQAICDDGNLSALDREMAQQFFAIFDRLSGTRQTNFRREQSQWRRDRDACGRTTGCIRANYVYRIGQFDRMTGATPSGAGAIDRTPDTHVLPDGSVEKNMPDGERVRYLPSGQEEHHPPNGEAYITNIQKMQVTVLTPPLSQYGPWIDGLSSSLLGILDRMMSDEEFGYYQSTEAGKDEYALIDWRLRFISLLAE